MKLQLFILHQYTHLYITHVYFWIPFKNLFRSDRYILGTIWVTFSQIISAEDILC